MVESPSRSLRSEALSTLFEPSTAELQMECFACCCSLSSTSGPTDCPPSHPQAGYLGQEKHPSSPWRKAGGLRGNHLPDSLIARMEGQ